MNMTSRYYLIFISVLLYFQIHSDNCNFIFNLDENYNKCNTNNRIHIVSIKIWENSFKKRSKNTFPPANLEKKCWLVPLETEGKKERKKKKKKTHTLKLTKKHHTTNQDTVTEVRLWITLIWNSMSQMLQSASCAMSYVCTAVV